MQAVVAVVVDDQDPLAGQLQAASPEAGRVGASTSSATIVKWNVDPLPGSLSAQIRPPMSSARRLQIASPRPVPPYRRVVEASTWLNDLEQAVEPVLRDPDAGVAHREVNLVA